LQDPRWLASLILDVNRVVRPALAIMDAVMAMEGPGPSGGNPRFAGALLAGSDLAAVDTIACRIIHLDPMSVPLLAAAREQGFGQTHMEGIKVAGVPWEEVQVSDFVKVHHPISPLRLLPLPWPALQWIRKQWTLRPRIIEERCTECGICEKGCPVSPAVIHPTWARHKVEIARCIRCYCCHEFCPSHAIELQKPWLMRHLPLETVGKAATRVVGALFRLRSRAKARRLN
jgi:NAD-dependent dihydropyrimidine dehydrogenase PreA subunit